MPHYPTDHRTPWIDDNGFLRVRTGNERRTMTAFEQDLRVAFALTADGPLRTILDSRATESFELEVWVTLTARISQLVSALAVLVSDVTSPLALSFREQIDKLLLPCQAFTDEESAVTWLKSIKV
jgi:hypothetical protein